MQTLVGTEAQFMGGLPGQDFFTFYNVCIPCACCYDTRESLAKAAHAAILIIGPGPETMH